MVAAAEARSGAAVMPNVTAARVRPARATRPMRRRRTGFIVEAIRMLAVSIGSLASAVSDDPRVVRA